MFIIQNYICLWHKLVSKDVTETKIYGTKLYFWYKMALIQTGYGTKQPVLPPSDHQPNLVPIEQGVPEEKIFN